MILKGEHRRRISDVASCQTQQYFNLLANMFSINNAKYFIVLYREFTEKFPDLWDYLVKFIF